MHDDSEQLERWYTTYAPSVKSYVRKKYGLREDEAEEITQDVFCNVLRHLSGPASSPIQHPQKWLYKIAENIVKNHFKEKSHFLIASHDDQDFFFKNLTDDEKYQPENQIGMENPELVGALKRLSPEQQRATVLHYGHQISFSEMSVMSGRSLKEEYRDARMGLEKLRRNFSLHKKA